MLKKLVGSKGYIFLEALLALTILTVVIGGFLSVDSILLSKGKAQEQRLVMKRILYEQLRAYEAHATLPSDIIVHEGKEYYMTVVLGETGVSAITIACGEERFTIEKSAVKD